MRFIWSKTIIKCTCIFPAWLLPPFPNFQGSNFHNQQNIAVRKSLFSGLCEKQAWLYEISVTKMYSRGSNHDAQPTYKKALLKVF